MKPRLNFISTLMKLTENPDNSKKKRTDQDVQKRDRLNDLKDTDITKLKQIKTFILVMNFFVARG